MLIRAAAGVGAAGFALAGPLLAVAAAQPLGLLGVAGVLAAWVGIGGVLAMLVLLLRAIQRQTRDLRTRADRTAERLTAIEEPLRDGALDGRFEAFEQHLDRSLATQRDEVLGTIDARVLGLHETVREVTALRDTARGER